MPDYGYTGYEWSGIAPDGSPRGSRWILTEEELGALVRKLFSEGWTLLNVRDPDNNLVATIGPDPGNPSRLSWWTLGEGSGDD